MNDNRKVEIEGQGVFSVPLPVWELLRDESARAEAAEAEVVVQRDARCHYEEKWRAAEAEVERLRAQVEGARVLLLRAGPHIPGSKPIRIEINAWLQANPRLVANTSQDAP